MIFSQEAAKCCHNLPGFSRDIFDTNCCPNASVLCVSCHGECLLRSVNTPGSKKKELPCKAVNRVELAVWRVMIYFSCHCLFWHVWGVRLGQDRGVKNYLLVTHDLRIILGQQNLRTS